MNKVELNRQVFDKKKFESTVDTTFTQLVSTEVIVEESTEEKIKNFFNLYQELFFDIPKEGEFNSHKYLILTSTDYVGTITSDEVKQLMAEIVNLRTQLLDSNQQIIDLNIKLATGTK